MASRAVQDDHGQIILLAGILLVLAFILFSTQLALLASIGQQSGRESENPLLDDYLLLRRTIETQWTEELRNATGVLVCPDMVIFGKRMVNQLELLEGLEKGRSNGLAWSELTLTRTSHVRLYGNLTLSLYDETTSIADRLSYGLTCDAATTPIQGPATCSPSPALCVLRLR